MKKLLLIAALMISAFSFANESNKEIVVKETVQNVLEVEYQIIEKVTLTTEELLTYCWTTVTMTEIGSPYTNDMGQTVQDYAVHTRTRCITV